MKQTLGFRQLDEAMEKLVRLARLNRPDNPYGHITENQHLPQFDKDGWIHNPLHTTVFATNVQSGVQFQDLAFRFGQINYQLGRRDMVTVLSVLGHGSAWYSVKGQDTINATFMDDRHDDLQLSVHNNEDDQMNTFYRLYVHLSGHLYRSVLATTVSQTDMAIALRSTGTIHTMAPVTIRRLESLTLVHSLSACPR